MYKLFEKPEISVIEKKENFFESGLVKSFVFLTLLAGFIPFFFFSSTNWITYVIAVSILLGGAILLWLFAAISVVNVNAYRSRLEIIQYEVKTCIPAEQIMNISSTLEPMYMSREKRESADDGHTPLTTYTVHNENRGILIETPTRDYVVSTDNPEFLVKRLRTLYGL